MDRVVARIGRAHGLRGEVTAEVRTDSPERRFVTGAAFQTDPAERGPLTLRSAREHSGVLLLAFEGVDDRDGAEALRTVVGALANGRSIRIDIVDTDRRR